MTKYINMTGEWGVETIDEFETMKEAKAMLKEYIISDPTASYYLSSRCSKEWKEK